MRSDLQSVGSNSRLRFSWPATRPHPACDRIRGILEIILRGLIRGVLLLGPRNPVSTSLSSCAARSLRFLCPPCPVDRSLPVSPSPHPPMNPSEGFLPPELWRQVDDPLQESVSRSGGWWWRGMTSLAWLGREGGQRRAPDRSSSLPRGDSSSLPHGDSSSPPRGGRGARGRSRGGQLRGTLCRWSGAPGV